MERTKEFLRQNRDGFEQYMNFEDHNIYYMVIEQKITPDNCIETCKSLIEGLCKSILQRVDLKNEMVRSRFTEQDLTGLDTTFNKMNGNGEDFHVLFQRTLLILGNYHRSFQKELLDSFGKNFCRYLGRVRNDRGDIAHGRAAPKIEKSSLELAYMIENLTDLITFHMLEILSLIDFEREDRPPIELLIEESFLNKEDIEPESIDLEEQKIRDFNETLDQQYSYEGKVRYSQALYEQYPEDYQTQLQEHLENLKAENGNEQPEAEPG